MGGLLISLDLNGTLCRTRSIPHIWWACYDVFEAKAAFMDRGKLSITPHRGSQTWSPTLTTPPPQAGFDVSTTSTTPRGFNECAANPSLRTD